MNEADALFKESMASYPTAKINGVTISRGNTKLGAIPSVSLAPWLSCLRNGPRDCIKLCYARKLARLRKCVSDTWEKNANIYLGTPNVYFDSVLKFLYQETPDRFRWHVAGDIPDAVYFWRMVDVAGKVPNTQFLAFTKSYDLLKYLPGGLENLTIRASAWPGPRWEEYKAAVKSARVPVSWVSHLKEATPAYTESIPSSAIECPGSCETCDICWEKKTNDVVFKAH